MKTKTAVLLPVIVYLFTVNFPIFYKGIKTSTVKTLNIGTLRPATVVVLNIKQFNFTRK